MWHSRGPDHGDVALTWLRGGPDCGGPGCGNPLRPREYVTFADRQEKGRKIEI